MKTIFRRRPTPAMGIALLALFVALSGTAVALPGKNRVDKNDYKRGSIGTRAIANNSIRSSDIRNSNVLSRDIRNGSVTGNDVDEDTLGTVPNANTVGGRTADSLDEPFRFARVLLAGDVDEANTKGLTDANVTLVGSVYCFDLPVDARSVTASVDWIGGGGDAVIHTTTGTFAPCPAGTDASARIVDASTGAAVTRDFYVQFIR